MKNSDLTKKVLRVLPLGLLFLVAGLASCNNDRETDSTLENSYGEGMVNSLDDRNKAPNDWTNAVSNEEGNIIFKLCDATLNPKLSFRKGENVVFDLVIENTSDNDLVLKRDFEGGDIILDSSCFCVYNEDGEIVGVPWTGVFCEESLQDTWYYPAHTIKHITCDWNQEWVGTSHPFCNGYDGEERRPCLPEGNYTVRFNVIYNTNIGKESYNYKNKEYIVCFKIR